MNETTPWQAMLGASLRFGVAPAAFWRLSLKEWRTLSGKGAAASPLARTAFDALRANFPDNTND